MPSAGAKNYCFTLNSNSDKGEHINWPTVKDCPVVDWWNHRVENDLVYMICQVEKAPSTGKYHIQGFISLSKRTPLTMLKRLFSKTAHWEVARGTPKENKEYCTKSESHINGPWEFGELPGGKGTRSDLKGIFKMVSEKKDNLAILKATEGKSSRFEKQINYIRFTLNEADSDRQATGVKVIVLYGPTGVGKTYSAVNTFGKSDYHLQECPSHKDTKMWFDGYQGQKTLILDDFSGDFCNYRYLLRVLDKYKLKVEVKGGHAWAVWDTVIITTNVHPANWFTGVDLAPLKRRITEIRFCEHQGSYRSMSWDETATGDYQLFQAPPIVAVPAADPPASSSTTEIIVLDTPENKRRRLRRTCFDIINKTIQKEKEKCKGVLQDCGGQPMSPVSRSDSGDEELLTDPDELANHDPDNDVRTCSPTQPWPGYGDSPLMGAQPM